MCVYSTKCSSNLYEVYIMHVCVRNIIYIVITVIIIYVLLVVYYIRYVSYSNNSIYFITVL